ncbi:MAG: AarF/UbiB family protein, partial [Chloroflexota bacterium]
FERDPLAAASIAQIHRATLADGTPVVVKVQRPGIEDEIDADLEIMHTSANILENTLGRNRGLLEIAEEFRVSLEGELDFRNEGRNADRLRHNMENIYNVGVPRIHWEAVSRRVLTMDYIEGVKITDIAAIRAAGLDPTDLATRFTEAMSKQILIDGFFHGDPHPGNVILNLKDGSINFLDMGMMGYLDEESRRELGNMMIALQQPDTRELVRIGIRLGVTFKKVDERALRRQLEHILNRYMVASLSQVSFADMMYEMMDTFFEYGVRLPPELTLAIKSLIQTQEIASTLNPQLQIADIADTVSDQLFWEQFKPSVVQDRLNETTAEVLRLAPIAADAVERVLREAKSGKLTIQLDTSDLQTQLDALSENTKRVTVGLTVAGMTIGSAIAMSVNPEEAWSFIPVLGVIGFTVSIAVGGLLILKLL